MDILIFGDSWGCGEWERKLGVYTLLHRGIEEYLSDRKYNVSNISEGAISNNESIKKLFFNLTDKKFNYIFWFQTNPLRNIRPYTTFKNDFKSYEELILKSIQLLNIDYEKLNELNVPIHCIGGCSKLNLKLMSKYQNLTPLIPSVTELILKNYCHPGVWIEEWNQMISGLDKKTIDLLYNDMKKIDQLSSVESYKEYFWPDGLHPNRKGHKILFDYICSQLNI